MSVVSEGISAHASANWRAVFGLILFVSGAMVLGDQIFHVHWLSLAAPLVAGLIILATGFRYRRMSYLIAGPIVLGVGCGFLLAFAQFAQETVFHRVGIGFIATAAGFAAVSVILFFVFRKLAWWPLIPFISIGSIGFTFAFTAAGFLDFILYGMSGLGLVLLAVGVYKRRIGLIIPGCLLIGIGPGISLAWGNGTQPNPLAQTGIMLLWFSLGWGLITLFSRAVIDQFVWWPLIPGGILAMVGWGLYIGGNPDNAVNFIGNTGSIAMIIFGLYLMLMRRGIRH